MDDSRSFRILRNIAVALTLLFVGFCVYEQTLGRPPADAAYLEGDKLFKDGFYQRALGAYDAALAADNVHLPALRGAVNALIQLQRFEEAEARIERAIKLAPEVGHHYMTRAIILDRTGRHRQALADYERSLELDPELDDGMYWLDRLLQNVQKKPTIVSERIRYLKQQFALPESERLLSVPELDAVQPAAEQ